MSYVDGLHSYDDVQFIIELLSTNVIRLVIMHVDCYSILKMSQQILVKEICFSLFIFLSRRKYEICVWKITHFDIKYLPLTIITFTVMFVLLCLNLYYFLNMFYCTNVTKVNRTRIGSWACRSTCLLLWLLLWLGLIILWLYITF